MNRIFKKQPKVDIDVRRNQINSIFRVLLREKKKLLMCARLFLCIANINTNGRSESRGKIVGALIMKRNVLLVALKQTRSYIVKM